MAERTVRIEARGFSLIEVMVAVALLAGTATTLVHLVLMTSRATLAARDVTHTSVLAAGKLSDLRTSDPGSLLVSTPEAWLSSEPGHVDYLDPSGRPLAVDGGIPDRAVYVRRWSITATQEALLIQVAAGRLRRDEAGRAVDAGPHDVARVVGLVRATP